MPFISNAAEVLCAIDERRASGRPYSVSQALAERQRRHLDRFIDLKRGEIANAIDSREARVIREVAEVWIDHWKSILTEPLDPAHKRVSALTEADLEAARTRLRERV